ncbi:MAG TPA: hypothetical protein VFM32_05100 [Spongiibacteraceae bacterium]|nr:hypothetical protein [Spongiibacteraceae bacterium]
MRTSVQSAPEKTQLAATNNNGIARRHNKIALIVIGIATFMFVAAIGLVFAIHDLEMRPNTHATVAAH